jgi:CRP/FNR family transcriptional regulator, cyclic AMP receptor protein
VTTPSGAHETFWSLLDASLAAELRSLSRTRTYSQGQALLHERQVADNVLVITSGWVKVVLPAATSHVVLAFRGPGELIGELAALDGGARSATVYAVEPVEALTLTTAAFLRFITDHPSVALILLGIVSRRLRDADTKRAEFATHVTMERVAARLLELGALFGRTDETSGDLLIPVSQEDLAGTTYASLESVGRALSKMRRPGWIETRRGEILVRDRDALARHAGQDSLSSVS